MAADMDWNELGAKINSLPNSWMPRREQPEWDRYFSGMAEIQVSFQSRTDKARTWALEAVAFSAVVKDGFETDENLMSFARQMSPHIAKGKNQFDA